MSAMVMNKSQFCDTTVVHGSARASAAIWAAAFMAVLPRLLAAASVALVLGLALAFTVATPDAPSRRVDVPAARTAAIVELPRVVIRGKRQPAADCPVPTDGEAALCTVPRGEPIVAR